MRIKKRILLCSLFIYLSINCRSQPCDSGVIKLPIYKISPCLFGLLTEVAESNKANYNGDQLFYSVILGEGKKYKYINIKPERWVESRYLDYKGVLEINSMFFLFRGNLDDTIFKKSSLPTVNVRLRQANDSLDTNSFFVEPSLRGVYHECKGMPIYMEIYTKSKIKNFDMKVHAPSSK